MGRIALLLFAGYTSLSRKWLETLCLSCSGLVRWRVWRTRVNLLGNLGICMHCACLRGTLLLSFFVARAERKGVLFRGN